MYGKHFAAAVVFSKWPTLLLLWVSLPLCACAQLLSLWDPRDCSPPGSSVHGISQARIPERVAISFAKGSCRPRDRTSVSCIGKQIPERWATREAFTQGYISLPFPTAFFFFFFFYILLCPWNLGVLVEAVCICFLILWCMSILIPWNRKGINL